MRGLFSGISAHRQEENMLQRPDERERPIEWLRELRESGSGYADLVRDSGDPLIAAHRLASARCRSTALSTPVPTLREMRAAFGDLCAGREPFSISRLRADCEKAGLLVIGAG
jgi:hypothetical protein